MRVCFDGLCFASKRPATEEETQTVLCENNHHHNSNNSNNITGGIINLTTSASSIIDSTTSNNYNNLQNKEFIKTKNNYKMQEPTQLQLQQPTSPTTIDIGNNNSQAQIQMNNCYATSQPIHTNNINANINTMDKLGNLCLNDSNNQQQQQPTQQQLLMTPKELELQQLLIERDTKIRELEDNLRRKNDEVAELRSHLDKFQSVFPFSRSSTGGSGNVSSSGSSGVTGRKAGTGQGVQRQRAQGISAEPQNETTVLEMLQVIFPKYDKADR